MKDTLEQEFNKQSNKVRWIYCIKIYVVYAWKKFKDVYDLDSTSSYKKELPYEQYLHMFV